MKIPLYFIVGCCLVVVAPTFSSTVPYAPKSDAPLLEQWRWTLLEDLDNVYTFYASAGLKGEIWLPNYDGIYRYDGHETIYFPYPKSWESSFPNGSHVASNGDVYVSTEHGLRRLSSGNWSVSYAYEARMDLRIVNFAETEQGILFARSPDGLLRIEGRTAELVPNTPGGIHSMAIHLGDLWFTNVFDNRIYRIDLDANDRVISDSQRQYELPADRYTHRTVLLNSSNYGLIAGNTDANMGLMRYDHATDNWLTFSNSAEHSSDHDIVIEASDGSIITYGSGYTTSPLLVLKEGRWSAMRETDRIPSSFPFIIAFRSGILIGGFREPTYYVDTSSERWESYNELNYQCEDHLKRHWFLSFDGQVVVQNPYSNEWISYPGQTGLIDSPTRIYCSKNNVIWVIGRHNGIAAISMLIDGEWTMNRHPGLGTIVDSRSIFEMPNGDILFGGGDPRGSMRADRGGIAIYSIQGGKYMVTYLSPPEVPNSMRGLIFSEGEYIFGGERLLRYSGGQLNPVLDDVSLDTEHLWLRGLHLTDAGAIWTTQWGNGIVEVSPTREWRRFNKESGLSSNHIAALALAGTSSAYELYACSENGVTGFDGESWSPYLFEIPFRVMFDNVTMYPEQNGALWINAVPRPWELRQGVPNEFLENRRSEFRTIRWKPRLSSPETYIEPMSQARFIESSNAIINWSGRTSWSITPKSQIVFSQRVNGGAWSPFSPDTRRIFFNMLAGDYIFEVRSRDLDGNIDSSPAAITFRVLPPIWKRTWFVITMLLVVILIISLISIIVRQRIRHILAMEEFRAEFFTNISHELRTPLAIILGPLDSLLEKTNDPWARDMLKIAHRAAQRVLNLVNQLLEMRKLEVGKGQHDHASTDLVRFMREEVDVLRSLAEEKSQELLFTSNKESHLADIQPDKLRIIVDNLISNALKYTQKGGRIEVGLHIYSGEAAVARLTVTDNGPGVPPPRVKNIFDAFYRGASGGTIPQVGTGIGLSLTKSLVTAIDGTISVKSPPPEADHGTQFTVEFPLRAPSEQKEQEIRKEDPLSDDEFESETEASQISILLAEDNEEILRFLEGELDPYYKVITAGNGRQALEICKDLIPDIVITDILMPEMDGRELCSEIKQDEITAHIPVIMLTALKSESHELKSLEVGADEYLVKPVKTRVLRQRIENLIHLRTKLRDQFTRTLLENPDEEFKIDAESPNQRFLKKLQNVVYSHIDDTAFTVDQLAKEMFVSKMTLHRKMKAITGVAPAAFVRKTRLKEAAKLLSTGEFQVSDVIQRVGFEDLSHFGLVFKKNYKMTPTQYIENAKASKKMN